MRFRVTRSSSFGEDREPPCEGAQREPGGGEEGKLYLYRPEDKWYVDIADLDALTAFVRKYGKVVVSYDPEPELEIYDDYRE